MIIFNVLAIRFKRQQFATYLSEVLYLYILHILKKKLNEPKYCICISNHFIRLFQQHFEKCNGCLTKCTKCGQFAKYRRLNITIVCHTLRFLHR